MFFYVWVTWCTRLLCLLCTLHVVSIHNLSSRRLLDLLLFYLSIYRQGNRMNEFGRALNQTCLRIWYFEEFGWIIWIYFSKCYANNTTSRNNRSLTFRYFAYRFWRRQDEDTSKKARLCAPLLWYYVLWGSTSFEFFGWSPHQDESFTARNKCNLPLARPALLVPSAL